ncbi:MAG TPA: hypothetical protein VFS20_23685 [Longimicrobium sp.]|nr:hypothetical protein [Longimicrobium sp.]
MRHVQTLALIASAATLAACGSDNRPGVLVGDAYIVTETGQEVNLAGMPVALVRETEQLDSLLATTCPRRPGSAEARPDSAAQSQAWQRRAQLLSAQAAKRAATDAAAHFRVDSVAPGRYRVWADTAYGGQRWSWLHEVTIEAGDTAKVALSNANPDDNPFRCRG